MDEPFGMEAVRISRALSSEPLPRRDSMEDADTSLMRKRPRLDNGGRAARSMSVDGISRSPSESKSADVILVPQIPIDREVEEVQIERSELLQKNTSSRIAINIRPQPISPEASYLQTQDRSEEQLQSEVQKSDPSECESTHVVAVQDAEPECGPEVVAKSPESSTRTIDIEIEAIEAEDVAEDQESQIIQIDAQPESLAEYFLEKFPFADRLSLIGAARTIRDHFEKGTHILSAPY